MKDANVGEFLLWEDKPAIVIGMTDQRTVMIQLLQNRKCPHCSGDIGKEQFSVVVASPLFQQSAAKLPTITDDSTLIISA